MIHTQIIERNDGTKNETERVKNAGNYVVSTRVNHFVLCNCALRECMKVEVLHGIWSLSDFQPVLSVYGAD